MEPLTSEEFRELATHRHPASVSVYMPSRHLGREARQNPIRFSNLLAEAAEGLKARSLDEDVIQSVLAPLERLVADDGFWSRQSDGLAAFAAPDQSRVYRLPVAVEQLLVVGGRFHLKPLLPILVRDGRFYLLALSQGRVRLFEASRHAMREMDTGDIPSSLTDALGYDWEERSLQFYSAAPRGGASSGHEAMYHGQGRGQDDSTAELRRFLELVDRGVRGLIPDPEAPLVVAAVEAIFGEYRKISHHQTLATDFVRGNPDHADPDELLRAAWKVAEPIFSADRREAAAKVRQLLGTGKASQQLEEVVVAAADGRVDSMFMAEGAQRWGRFSTEDRRVEVHGQAEPRDEDLLNRAAVETFVHDGTVYVVPPREVPSDHGSPVAAVLRY
jgi:hypothetical protein